MRGARRTQRFGPAMVALALAFGLSACESFDIGDLFPDTKKRLPGERKEVFPGGVPGVTQGVPAELVKGNTPPQDPNAAALEQLRQADEQRAAAEQKAAEEQAKQRARAQAQAQRRAAQPKPAPQQQQEAAQPAQQNSAWPNQQPQQPAASSWPNQQAGQAAWPAPPQSGTFSR